MIQTELDLGKDSAKQPKLSAKQVCDILKACNENGVKTIKVFGLEVEFFGSAAVKSQTADESFSESELTAQAVGLDQAEGQAVNISERELKDDQLARMLVEDPVEYERLAVAGDLDADQVRSSEE